ncbi:MAG TPA: nuclear transport factor 2 family protein [Burkholderiaceae bacterium]|nr:nuclear transport factor 2 family protein [Burkholderiaceae bacterium]
MTDRVQIERLLQTLYAARVGGDLDTLCRTFADDAKFRIAGASDGKPISISAVGTIQIRTWLNMMIKTFRMTDQSTVSIVIEGAKAAVHWRCTIHSKITGTVIPTDLVDLVEVRDGRIGSYTEFFVPH